MSLRSDEILNAYLIKAKLTKKFSEEKKKYFLSCVLNANTSILIQGYY